MFQVVSTALEDTEKNDTKIAFIYLRFEPPPKKKERKEKSMVNKKIQVASEKKK